MVTAGVAGSAEDWLPSDDIYGACATRGAASRCGFCSGASYGSNDASCGSRVC